MPNPPAATRLLRSALLVALAAAALGLAGCYERVVSAHGLGADRIETQEPYQESGEIDRWVFGDKPSPQRR